MNYGEKILQLTRERRRYEVQTIDGYKPKYEITPCDVFARQMYDALTKEIERVSYIVGKENVKEILANCTKNPSCTRIKMHRIHILQDRLTV